MEVTLIDVKDFRMVFDGKESIAVERCYEGGKITDRVDISFGDTQESRLIISLPNHALIQLKAEVDKFLLSELSKKG